MNTFRLGWTLIHFLWQGALVALVYAVARRFAIRAGVRYLLACLALAAMTAAPAITWLVLRPADAAEIVAPDRTARAPGAIAARPVAVPLPGGRSVPAAPKTAWLAWTVAVWMAGAGALSLRLLAGWLLAARLRWNLVRPAPLEWIAAWDRLRARLGVARAIGLRVSAMVKSPVAVGALRPLVLVPVGMLAGMPAAQVEALLLHELAHIRRHDYLVNVLQSVVEALLFYHPAVWWVSHHIRLEREHCCDDVAVAVSGDRLTYVTALAELADRPQEPLAAVAANGGSLTGRIARLLGDSRPSSAHGPARGTAVALLAVAAAAYGLFAQETPRPAFQAASVKPNTDNPPNRMQRPLPGGRFTARNTTLQMLILTAYGILPYQLSGGPSWMESDGFDIEAKGEGDANQAQIVLMLQSLLAERFKLALHRETRQLPTYDLTVVKGRFQPPVPKSGGCASLDSGRPLPPGTPPCGMVRMGFSGSMDGVSVPMANLVKSLAGIVGRPVIDQTGFQGTLDVHLKFLPDQATRGLPTGGLSAALPDPDPSRPNIFEAVQEQLGLKLTASKGPVEVLVIDHAEHPTAN